MEMSYLALKDVTLSGPQVCMHLYLSSFSYFMRISQIVYMRSCLLVVSFNSAEQKTAAMGYLCYDSNKIVFLLYLSNHDDRDH